jgi:hypothetical protein
MCFKPGNCDLSEIYRINPKRVLIFPKYFSPVVHKMQIFPARKYGLRGSLYAIQFNRKVHRLTSPTTSVLARKQIASIVDPTMR